MRLMYDNIVFALQKFGGISVVWQELLEHISHIDNIETNYIDIIASQNDNYSRSKLSFPSSDIIRHIRFPKIERYLPVRINSDRPFIFHSSYYRYCTNPNAINITTVHDFTYEFFVKGIKQKVHTLQKFAAIRHSDAVVCISENTKRDLLRLMPDIEEDRVHVIYNGVSSEFHLLEEECDLSLLPFPSKSYVIFIGRRDNYKNFDLTVKAVSKTNYNLLIVGNKLNDEEMRFVNELLPQDRYKCLSHLPDEKLNLFYNHAIALVYPSSYEGFGIPVLEAQRAGCPVIAHKSSSIPEVIGETPLLMQELTEKDLVEKLLLLNNRDLMQQVKSTGLANAEKFTWQNMAKGYHSIYQRLWSAACKA